MRRNDWPQRLAEFIESTHAEPFCYGSHDCCMFAGRAVEAMTGENPTLQWNYSNEIGAKRLLARKGGLVQMLSETLGIPIHPSEAGRGDVVLAELDLGPSVGICLGRMCVFATEPAGVLMLGREIAHLAWRI